MTPTATTRSPRGAGTTSRPPARAEQLALTPHGTPIPHGCPRCWTRWGGALTAHCGTCHATFTRPSGFDRHRRAGACIHPGLVGLVVTRRTPNGGPIWGYPPDPDYRPHPAAHRPDA